jgi:flagellar motility protein MotE (MotC chaperone)
VTTIRLIPAVGFATASLLALKAADLALNDGLAALWVRSAAAESANHGKPASGAAAAPASATPRLTEIPAPAVPSAAPPLPGGADSERAVLERLAERRAEIEARARELDMRENLLKAAEARLEGRIGELKAMEARIGEAERKRDDEAKAKVEGLVTMYESMKAKDAARILSRLELPVLLAVVERMNPRKMADILAAMDPEPAQKLTVELATRGERRRPAEARAVQDLPKIEARH